MIEIGAGVELGLGTKLGDIPTVAQLFVTEILQDDLITENGNQLIQE